MYESFDAAVFMEQLQNGDFDGHLQEELWKLTDRELNEVSALWTAAIKNRLG